VVASKLLAVTAAGVMGACAAALVADTTVVLDGEILGKPATVDEAEAMVRRLAGARTPSSRATRSLAGPTRARRSRFAP
jgi:predicted house-cleaning NTP pyrophosphatase (Maf/HAM1 superfamily)